MKDEAPTPSPVKSKAKRPTRKLSLLSRLRASVRRGKERVLATDVLWSALFVLVVVLLIGSQSCDRALPEFAEGEVARTDVRAPYDIDVVDEALTDARRREAAEGIPDVYAYDTERGIRLADELSLLIQEGRTVLERATLEGRENPAPAGRTALEGRLPAEPLEVLIAQGFNVDLEHELVLALTQIMSQMIIGNKALLERAPRITLVRLPERREEVFEQYETLTDLDKARAALVEQLGRRLTLSAQQEQALATLVASYVDANVQLDATATHQRREEAQRKVPIVLVRLAQGELLVREGERISAEVLAKLEAARRRGGVGGLQSLLAIVFIATAFAFFIYRYSAYHQRRFRKIAHLHALMVLMMVGTLLLSEGILWLAGKVVYSLGSPFNHLSSYTYLIPLGAGSILVALLANGRIAIAYAGFVSPLFGALNGWDAQVTVWAMVVQCAGVYAISTYRERAALLRAGLVVGGVAALGAIALETLNGNMSPVSIGLYGAALAFVGGAVGVGLLVSFSLPLLEGMFDVLTEIRLLELSNINNPLLSQLAVKAPGSYNHSLVVGNLAEEGAKAIGASSLFCRVAAFYHDIGKMSKPEYYVENQRGSNPHDRLAPSMSALIIASHVKDGIRMAREAGLPEPIIDIIPQHHGTKLMTYFYEKARSSTDPSLGPVKEEDFRYPGPKPQTREAAIFMLADSVEAAARTIDEPTPNRLREMIRKVTNAILLDEQLDACELTFVDLSKIQDAFLRLLVSMYHHRVDYPGFEFNRPRGESRPAEITETRIARGS